jgi:hypothetical protein
MTSTTVSNFTGTVNATGTVKNEDIKASIDAIFDIFMSSRAVPDNTTSQPDAVKSQQTMTPIQSAIHKVGSMIEWLISHLTLSGMDEGDAVELAYMFFSKYTDDGRLVWSTHNNVPPPANTNTYLIDLEACDVRMKDIKDLWNMRQFFAKNNMLPKQISDAMMFYDIGIVSEW